MEITVIGSGNMGGTIARALVSHPNVGAACVTSTARTRQTLEKTSVSLPGVRVTTDNREAVGGADMVILAVKPWILPEVIAEVRDLLVASCPVVVSVAAGVSLDDLEAMLSADCAAAGSGVTCCDGGDSVGKPAGETAASSEKITDGQQIAIFRVIPNTAISVGKGMTFISSKYASDLQ